MINTQTVIYHLASTASAAAGNSAVTIVNFGIPQIIGLLLMMVIGGLHALAGLGGGGPNVVILILLFGMVPKQATIAVYGAIFGATFGNIINQTRRLVDRQQIINYDFASITIPIVFIGAQFGVMINQFLPSVATITLIIMLNAYKIYGTLGRFRKDYAKETEQINNHQGRDLGDGIIEEERINPFSIHQNNIFFAKIGILVILYIVLSMMRGSIGFQSIFGIAMCTPWYWILQTVIIIMALIFFWHTLKIQRQKHQAIVAAHEEHVEQAQQAIQAIQPEQQVQDVYAEAKQKQCLLILNSLVAGLVGGLGLGGGVILVPLYRQLGLSPVHASGTSSFTVFIISGTNVIQALFLGKLGFVQFLIFFAANMAGSFFLADYLGNRLRQMHRISLVGLLLFFLAILISLCLLITMWLTVQSHGGNTSYILGFGNICGTK